MRGVRASHCQNHLHQLHVCLPSGPGRTRLLYRMSMDFLAWTRHIPLIQNFWSHIAGQVSPYALHRTSWACTQCMVWNQQRDPLSATGSGLG